MFNYKVKRNVMKQAKGGVKGGGCGRGWLAWMQGRQCISVVHMTPNMTSLVKIEPLYHNKIQDGSHDPGLATGL